MAFDEIVESIEDESEETDPIYHLIYGTAGSGKSYLIKCLKQRLGDSKVSQTQTPE